MQITADVSEPKLQPLASLEPVKSLPDSRYLKAVRGVASGLQKRYLELQAIRKFACFDQSNNFSTFDVVNDEYCDCPDGSDEPGTSACSGVQLALASLPGFLCGWQMAHEQTQLPHWAARVVRRAAVNDGICDCCGGEDEWELNQCPNTCAFAQAAEEEESHRASAGSRARQALVEKAKALQHTRKHAGTDGGPENVYLAVAEEGCVTKNDGDFNFQVCIFGEVKQTEVKSGHQYKLGEGGEWSVFLWENGEDKKDYSKLIMGGGDYCFASQAPRRAEVVFECAETPSVEKVQETQVCVYTITFRTPAACHPLQQHGP